MSRYRKNRGAVFSVKYHIVWCPKYRLKVLQGSVADRLKCLLNEKARELEMTIHALEIMPDPMWAIAGKAYIKNQKGR